MNRETLLEYRYRRLLRCYPRAWRAEREDEVVATYLDSGPGTRRRPSTMDTADVLLGALRHRIALAHPGSRAGSALAAELALTAASVLAALWFCLVELADMPADHLLPVAGPVQTLGAAVWIAWAAVPVAGLFLSGRAMRAVSGTALVLTALVVPAAELTPYIRPYLTILVPQFALGVVTLFLAERRRPLVRALPVAAMLVAAGTALGTGPWETAMTYRSGDLDSLLLLATAVALAVIAAGHSAVRAIRHRAGDLWAPLVLAAPITLLLLEWVPGPAHPTNAAYDSGDVLATVAVIALGAATMLAAAAARREGGRA